MHRIRRGLLNENENQMKSKESNEEKLIFAFILISFSLIRGLGRCIFASSRPNLPDCPLAGFATSRFLISRVLCSSFLSSFCILEVLSSSLLRVLPSAPYETWLSKSLVEHPVRALHKLLISFSFPLFLPGLTTEAVRVCAPSKADN